MWLLIRTCAVFFSGRRRHTRFKCDWSSDVCSSDLWGGEASLCPRIGLGARGSIVAIGDAEPRLGLLRNQALLAGLELIGGNGLDHVSLPGDQDVDTLQCLVNALAEPCNLDVVSDVTVRRRLSRPNEGVILPSESVERCIEFVQVYICRGQPVVVFGFQSPCEHAAQASRPLLKRERFGIVRVPALLLDPL